MKIDILKILIIPTILISVFFMTKYKSYGGKGDYIINDYSYLTQTETKTNKDWQDEKNEINNCNNKLCKNDCLAGQNKKIDVIKCLDSCACNDSEAVIIGNQSYKPIQQGEPRPNIISSPITNSKELFSQFNIYSNSFLTVLIVAICMMLILLKIGKTKKQIKKSARFIYKMFLDKFKSKRCIKTDYMTEDDINLEEEFKYKKLTDI